MNLVNQNFFDFRSSPQKREHKSVVEDLRWEFLILNHFELAALLQLRSFLVEIPLVPLVRLPLPSVKLVQDGRGGPGIPYAKDLKYTHVQTQTDRLVKAFSRLYEANYPEQLHMRSEASAAQRDRTKHRLSKKKTGTRPPPPPRGQRSKAGTSAKELDKPTAGRPRPQTEQEQRRPRVHTESCQIPHESSFLGQRSSSPWPRKFRRTPGPAAQRHYHLQKKGTVFLADFFRS